jgi:endonuclease YncB( thermonuclease family)
MENATDNQVVNRLLRLAAAAGVLLLILPTLVRADGQTDGSPRQFVGTVTHVPDGDTFTLRTAVGSVRVRLSGVDAPESGQPYARRAQSALAGMLGVLTIAQN